MNGKMVRYILGRMLGVEALLLLLPAFVGILYGEEKLILIALGPTATVLAYDLSKFGYWAIDIGHVDMEYLWMKHKVKEKIPLKGRVLNEVVGAQESELEELENNLYMESIVFNVK